ncbi:isochorismate synthase [Halopenitus sp. POP-27]|uniref:isochorismate synthase n=1 Tax=Halopenitus sp. POP-27 TaxID=2994425 RepID=UPI00246906B5|nr:isochorismate synthase [Halopenitus sp. POP-27]
MDPFALTDSSRLVSRARRIDDPSFRAAFEAIETPRVVWGAPEESTVIGGGAAATLTASGPDRFATIRDGADRLFASGDVHAGTEAARPRLFGGFAFHEAATDGEPWASFPEARFVFPRVQVTAADNGTWVTVNAVGPDVTATDVERRLDEAVATFDGLGAADRGADDHGTDASDGTADPDRNPDRPGIVSRHRTTTREEWRTGVEAAVDRIRQGDLEKVVLAQALAVELRDDAPRGAMIDRLRHRYPNCYPFLIETDAVEKPDTAGTPDETGTPDAAGAAFVGATPERLVSMRGRTVETDALAGTTGRGETPEEDEWLASELAADRKNGHEHDLVVEAIRDQLEPFTASISTGDRRIKRLAEVQHLHTPITADLAATTHVLELVEALHPTPAVGGLPPAAALETIRETEPFDRGWYAAPVGWIDAAGNGTFTVGIRSAVLERRQATLFAGVGIVADSDADEEWDEIQLKYRPILNELED